MFVIWHLQFCFGLTFGCSLCFGVYIILWAFKFCMVVMSLCGVFAACRSLLSLVVYLRCWPFG